MSIKPCSLCRRYDTCEHPEKTMDQRPVQNCSLFRYVGERGDRTCLECEKYGGNCGDCRGTREFAQHCGSYKRDRSVNVMRGPVEGQVQTTVFPPRLMKHTRAPEVGPAYLAYDGNEDMLQDLFGMQYELNKKAGFDAYELILDDGHLDLLEGGKWLNAYITAMIGELCELRDMTYWKHWYKEAREGRQYEIHNLDHAKVEAVDCLFFLISIFEALGMSANEVFALYEAKLAKNHARQDDDCTTEEAKGYDL